MSLSLPLRLCTLSIHESIIHNVFNTNGNILNYSPICGILFLNFSLAFPASLDDASNIEETEHV